MGLLGYINSTEAAVDKLLNTSDILEPSDVKKILRLFSSQKEFADRMGVDTRIVRFWCHLTRGRSMTKPNRLALELLVRQRYEG